MADAPNEFVPEGVLDYDEIIRRGGANCGDEDFALCKCPHCDRIYLVDYEVDTLYLDPRDLRRRVDVSYPAFSCPDCGKAFPQGKPWVGPRASTEMQVTWVRLQGSDWNWVVHRDTPESSRSS